MVMDDVTAAGHLAAWFTAWKYDKEDALWRALLLCVIDAVRQGLGQGAPAACQALDALEDTLYQAIQQVEVGRLQFDLRQFLAGAVETGAQVALATIPGLNLSEQSG